MVAQRAKRGPDDSPDETGRLVITMNTALVGVPAAYAVSGSVTVTAIAAGLAATIAAVTYATRRRR